MSSGPVGLGPGAKGPGSVGLGSWAPVGSGPCAHGDCTWLEGSTFYLRSIFFVDWAPREPICPKNKTYNTEISRAFTGWAEQPKVAIRDTKSRHDVEDQSFRQFDGKEIL